MPRHKSAEKRVRQDKKRGLRNKAERTRIKSAIKSVRESTTPEAANRALVESASLLDKAAKRSVVHRRTADRMKSRLARAANRVAAAEQKKAE